MSAPGLDQLIDKKAAIRVDVEATKSMLERAGKRVALKPDRAARR